jgi:sigma-B regulation protein RsbU (phosphoserine phosphatase)
MVGPIDFQTLYEHAACGLISFEIDGTIIHVNQTLLNWLNYNIAEIRGTAFQDLLTQGGKLYFSLFVLPSLQMQSEIKEVNIDMQTPTGSFSALFSAVTYVQNEVPPRIDATIFKIADRKKYEAEILKEKEQVKEENVKTNQILAEVAFNQAHLIRAPLANIMGLIGLLEEDPKTHTEDRRTLAMLKASASNLDSVINEILGLIN